MKLNEGIRRAYDENVREREQLLGVALGILLDHFDMEAFRIAATKGKKGTRISFPLAGGWELVRDWEWPVLTDEEV